MSYPTSMKIVKLQILQLLHTRKRIIKHKRSPDKHQENSVKSEKKVKHNVLIIGDSYASNSASLLQDNLNTDYEVSRFVKPGAHMNAITDTAREAVKSLKSVMMW
jgi:hypothetical protein